MLAMLAMLAILIILMMLAVKIVSFRHELLLVTSLQLTGLFQQGALSIHSPHWIIHSRPVKLGWTGKFIVELCSTGIYYWSMVTTSLNDDLLSLILPPSSSLLASFLSLARGDANACRSEAVSSPPLSDTPGLFRLSSRYFFSPLNLISARNGLFD